MKLRKSSVNIINKAMRFKPIGFLVGVVCNPAKVTETPPQKNLDALWELLAITKPESYAKRDTETPPRNSRFMPNFSPTAHTWLNWNES